MHRRATDGLLQATDREAWVDPAVGGVVWGDYDGTVGRFGMDGWMDGMAWQMGSGRRGVDREGATTDLVAPRTSGSDHLGIAASATVLVLVSVLVQRPATEQTVLQITRELRSCECP